MRILNVTIYRLFFDQIAEGTKTEEYRVVKPYWTKRLAQGWDVIVFRNGYATDCPRMMVEFLGYEQKMMNDSLVYAIKLGAIISTSNYEKSKQTGDSRIHNRLLKSWRGTGIDHRQH